MAAILLRRLAQAFPTTPAFGLVTPFLAVINPAMAFLHHAMDPRLSTDHAIAAH
jgi:hypothetical protein